LCLNGRHGGGKSSGGQDRRHEKFSAIERRCLEITDRLVAGLRDRGFAIVSSRRPGEWSAIVAATHPDRAPNELARQLHERGIVAAHRAGRLRISPHFYNTPDEIDRLLEAL